MAEEDPIQVEGPPPEEASNRTFIILAILLGSLFLVGLVCIGLYAVFLGPLQASARQTELAMVNEQNTQVVGQNTQAAASMTEAVISAETTQQFLSLQATEAAAEAQLTAQVPTATHTPVVAATATATSEPTETREAQVETQAAIETEAAGIGGGDETPGPTATGPTPVTSPTRLAGTPSTNTPTPLAGAPTATRLPGTAATNTPTPVAGAPTATATASELPDTGFAGDANLAGMLMLAAALVLVVVVARRVRMGMR